MNGIATRGRATDARSRWKVEPTDSGLWGLIRYWCAPCARAIPLHWQRFHEHTPEHVRKAEEAA